MAFFFALQICNSFPYIAVHYSMNRNLILKDLTRYGRKNSSNRNLIYCILLADKAYRNVLYYRLSDMQSYFFLVFCHPIRVYI